MKNSKKKAVFLDLWKTLVTSHCREPVWNLQRAIGHNLFVPGEGKPEVFEPDDDFLRWCLTTPILDKDEFVHEAARRFKRSAPGSNAFKEFEAILQGESGCVARFEDVNATLIGLQERGYEIGVISNLWPFPAERIFDINGLGQFFEKKNRIYSFQVQHRKPEPQIYEAACRAVGAAPHECLMIGDNLEADVIGAQKFGMDAALIDRPGDFAKGTLPGGTHHLRSLTDILAILDAEEQG
jgi:HAD superfamily hydrolase (TIGR01549 family)